MEHYLLKYRKELEEITASGGLRSLRQTTTLPGGEAEFNGRRYVNFSGNDYLGLAGNIELRREFLSIYAEELPLMGSTGSRLLGGNSPCHAMLEKTLERLYGKRALVLNSGYHANVGILPAITNRESLILSDKLNHASIVDGLRLCDGEFKRYKHLDYEQLEGLLDKSQREGRQPFIITESIFSMDGDTADLRKIVELKKKYGAFLIVDEAHSVGVVGKGGLGLCSSLGILDDVDIMIGTFGKALASAGAYCITGDTMHNYLINFMRPFIFSTALPPAVALWSNFILEKLAGFEDRRSNLAKLGNEIRRIVATSEYKTLGDSQLVPLIVGENNPALALAEKFREHGMLVFAVRPPTVPPGTSRLRLSLNAAMSPTVADKIGELLN